MSENFLKLHGRLLLAQGYGLAPIRKGFKHPKGLKHWQKEKSNIKNLDKWINMGFTGVGINARTCPGVDLDIYDEAVLRVVLQAVVNIAGDSYHRIGAFPKVLLPYRTDKPFKKIQSKSYMDKQGRRNKVEILCDGQQFLHSAGHPDTGKDYYWPPGEGLNGSDPFPLTNVPLETLPSIDEEQCRMIVEAFEAAIPDDWVEESVWLKNKKKSITGKTMNFVAFDETAEIAKDKVDSWMDEVAQSDDVPDAPQDGDAFQYLKPKINISMDQVRRTLKDIPADDYSIWIMVGMALHHQTDGDADGLAIWDEWSLKADNYSPEIINEKWDTFKAEDQAPVTFLTVLRMAREIRTKKDPLREFIDRYVYITDGDRVVDLDKSPMAKPMEMKEFKNRTANVRLTIDVAAPTIKDPTRTKPIIISIFFSGV